MTDVDLSDHNYNVVYRPALIFSVTIVRCLDNDGYGGPTDHICDAVDRPSLFFVFALLK